jgi:hypothetical protein
MLHVTALTLMAVSIVMCKQSIADMSVLLQLKRELKSSFN